MLSVFCDLVGTRVDGFLLCDAGDSLGLGRVADGSVVDVFGPDDFAELPPALELWPDVLDDSVLEEATDDFCDAPVEGLADADIVDVDTTSVGVLKKLPWDSLRVTMV